jgi:PAS domain S-box-containing protein
MSDKLPELRQALDHGEIVPYFQPQVSLRTGELHGFEVLARWHHPTRGLIFPDEFIPASEAGNLIDSLTKKIVSVAVGSASLWPNHLRLAINISASQLLDPGFARRLQAVVERGELPMHRIVIEITESALIKNLSRARTIAEELHQAGAKLSLDDFGTGYSSLLHLRALPFDEIKVDASFVRSICQSRETRKIIAAVIGLGNSLGLETMAEGIEKQAQADLLASLGCDFGQGWLYGRAVPVAEAAAQIAKFQPPANLAADLFNSVNAVRFEAHPSMQLAQLRAIYDAVPVGLCFLDRKLRYVNLNRQLAEMHNIPLEAHIGRTLPEVLPHIAKVAVPHLYRALAGEAELNVEVRVEQEASSRTFLVCYQPARDEVGELVGILIAVQDLTERQSLKLSLKSLPKGDRAS